MSTSVRAGVENAPGRTVGAGLSPGDGSYAEPYYYVTPYPYPQGPFFTTKKVGAWHTDGWVGAVLTASELIREKSAAQQGELLQRFLTEWIDTCEALV